MASLGSSGGEPEFQVAPMIDVLLTILVFFMMITSAQVLKVDKTIKLPIAPDALKKDNQRSETIVNVRWKPETRKVEFVLDERSFAKASEMEPVLKAAKESGLASGSKGGNPNFRVVIRGDRDVPAGEISQAMNACGDAGITDISFSAVNKE
jgi:biopolymer transport protein ExbD